MLPLLSWSPQPKRPAPAAGGAAGGGGGAGVAQQVSTLGEFHSAASSIAKSIHQVSQKLEHLTKRERGEGVPRLLKFLCTGEGLELKIEVVLGRADHPPLALLAMATTTAFLPQDQHSIFFKTSVGDEWSTLVLLPEKCKGLSCSPCAHITCFSKHAPATTTAIRLPVTSSTVYYWRGHH